MDKEDDDSLDDANPLLERIAGKKKDVPSDILKEVPESPPSPASVIRPVSR